VQQFQISHSLRLKIINLSLYLAVIVAIVVFADEMLTAGLLLLLTLLLMISDYQDWKSVKWQAPTDLRLFPDSGIIEIQQLGRQQRFKIFSLYLNRWFLIVRLQDRYRSRNFLLIADRFRSVSEYLNFRRLIVKMNRDQYAT